MTKVSHVNFNDKVNHRVMLRRLADDPELKGAVVVCLWDDDSLTTGCSSMPIGSAAYAALKIQQDLVDIMEDSDASRQTNRFYR